MTGRIHIARVVSDISSLHRPNSKRSGLAAAPINQTGAQPRRTICAPIIIARGNHDVACHFTGHGLHISAIGWCQGSPRVDRGRIVCEGNSRIELRLRERVSGYDSTNLAFGVLHPSAQYGIDLSWRDHAMQLFRGAWPAMRQRSYAPRAISILRRIVVIPHHNPLAYAKLRIPLGTHRQIGIRILTRCWHSSTLSRDGYRFQAGRLSHHVEPSDNSGYRSTATAGFYFPPRLKCVRCRSVVGSSRISISSELV